MLLKNSCFFVKIGICFEIGRFHMNQKELNEIRRRFKPDKDSISHIYGCYVNAAKEIVSYIDMSVGLMPEEEAEIYLKLLKKSISGTLGRNLLDIEFSTSQVSGSEEHGLLMKLRGTELKDESVRDAFYSKITDVIDMGEQSYVILLAQDAYDVPFKGSDGEGWQEASDEVFRYFICGIYPVKDATMALRYFAEEKQFRSASTGHIISAPEIGFMFPAFDERSANIYNALYYTKDISEIHSEFIDSVFNIENIPMSAGAQRGAFAASLCESLEADCSFDVVQAVHEQIREKLAIHKESKEPELPQMNIDDVEEILINSGIDKEKTEAFHRECEKQFGSDATLNPSNVIESKKFEITTPEIKISVNPEFSYMVETRIIDGRKYILIPAGEGVEINGLDVSIEDKSKEA